jgi:hypothetical protein
LDEEDDRPADEDDRPPARELPPRAAALVFEERDIAEDVEDRFFEPEEDDDAREPPRADEDDEPERDLEPERLFDLAIEPPLSCWAFKPFAVTRQG